MNAIESIERKTHVRKTNADATSSPPAVDLIVPRQRAGREYLLMSAMTLWRRERSDPTFPKALVIGPKRYGYRLSEIRQWLDARPRAGFTRQERPTKRSSKPKNK